MNRTQSTESAVESLIELFETDGRVGVNEGRDALLDLCEAHPGRIALTNPLGNESYHACRQRADGVEWCHWIEQSESVWLATTNRYITGFGVSPHTNRLIDVRCTPGTFQLFLGGLDVDGEPVGSEQTALSAFGGERA
jgi:hypothetical protein